MRLILPITVCVILVVVASPAMADVLLLKDGRIVEGHKLTKAEKGIT